MRNRTALTEAVASGAPAPEPPAGPADDVFGKVAGPGGEGPGARVQDLELFDAAATLPTASGESGRHRARHGAGKPRIARRAAREPGAAREPRGESRRDDRNDGRRGDRDDSRGGLSLPLLITGALAAGFGLSVGLTSGLDHEPADRLTLTMPDLPSPEATPATGTPAPAPPSGTTPPPAAETARPTARATASATTAAPPSAAASATTAPRAPRRTSAPPAPSAPPATHRPDPTPTRVTPPPERPDSDVLKVGSTGPEVEELQRRLQRLWLYLGSADGTFGTYLESALVRFQVSRGIQGERGVLGPLTRAALWAETERDDRDDRDGWGGGRDDRGDRDGLGGWFG
ncbi:peptidoglycan-binding domain-containing protein [Streptomyces omiyaensis]|uniref:peptidoglycan-binding domain-containing protein n=1 Tax=Streptomyces omiyaensis TaxID=68247 RepID=UPI0036FBA1B6